MVLFVIIALNLFKLFFVNDEQLNIEIKHIDLFFQVI